MKKYVLVVYKTIMFILLFVFIVLFSMGIEKKDKLITEHITLKYFENSMNNYNPEELKQFVASSENDTLYKQAVKIYEINHYDGVKDFTFKIDNYEEFGTGKYQCYYNYYNEPTCDVKNEGKYMNYMIDTTTTYLNAIGQKQVIKEKGLVVFVKDASNGNMFEWRLVRYNTYIIK